MRYLSSVFARHTAGNELIDFGGRPELTPPSTVAPKFLGWCRSVTRLAGSFHDVYVDRLPDGMYGMCSDDSMWISLQILDDFPTNEVLDVAAAIALHESGHALYTTQKCPAYLRRREPLKWSLYNFFEDERIEAMLSEEAPAFAGHMELSANLVNNSFEKSTTQLLNRLASGKETIAEADLTEEEKQWLAQGNKLIDLTQHAKEMLCTNYARSPRQFARMRNEVTGDLKDFADKLAALDIPEPTNEDYNSRAATVTVLRLLEDGVAEYHIENAAYFETPETEEERAERVEREEAEAKLDEEMMQKLAEALRQLFKAIVSAAKTTLEEMAEKAAATPMDVSPDKEPGPPEEMSDEGRKLVQALAQLAHGDGTEKDEAPMHGEIDYTVIGEAKTDGMEVRETIPRNTLSSIQRYATMLDQVKNSAQALSSVFNVRAKPKKIMRAEQKVGRIHSRRLALARVTDKVFQTSAVKKLPGIDITMLVDCSGSMGGYGSSQDGKLIEPKIDRATKAAILLALAAKKISGVTLRVYGHTTGYIAPEKRYSSREENHTCETYCFYDPRRKLTDLRKLGTIHDSGGNFDNLAIEKVTDRILATTTELEDRWLIVISDGMPNSYKFTGKSAVKATKDAVTAARNHGIHVLAVDIEGSQCENIYGKEHVCKFTDPSRFVTDMRTLVLRMIRRSTERSVE